ncbi:hypothetical protein L227DRAFT_486902, partial [Lentinus tigrinus ALCF2SS1-6]
VFFLCGTPNLAKVIPAMDSINKHLTTTSISDKFTPAIHAACKLAKVILNKYYSLSDASKLYHLTIMLHLLMKLEYFQRMKWPEIW